MTASPVPSSRTDQRSYVGELWRRREFAWYSALAAIQSRSSTTALGLIWWMLNPLMLGLVFLVVFGFILNTHRGDPNYIGFILSGLFPFYATRTVMASGATSMSSNARLIATRQFPRILLPITAVLEASLALGGALVGFFLIAGFAAGDWPGSHTLILIPAFVIHTAFNMGLAALFAQLILRFRDVANVTQYLGRIWLYTSPVIWPIDVRLDNLPEWAVQIFSYNPMAAILGLYRGALLGREVAFQHWWKSIAWALLFFIIGIWTFARKEDDLVRYLD